MRLFGLVLGLALATGCTTGEKKGGAGGGSELGGGKAGGGGGKESNSANASAQRVTFTNSMSNNGLTSQTINRGKAESEAQHFAGAKDAVGLESRIAAERLAGKSGNEVLATAKRLSEVIQEKGGAGKSIPEEVKLDIALAAVQSHNFSLALYLLQELSDSKNGRVKAGAYNAMGVMALRDDRVPEAVLYFKSALSASSGYKPALLNLGFAALKGGDMKLAKESLSSMQNDWFVQYGLISVNRIDGGNAGELCDRVLKVEPGHIGALFNCGLYEYQNKHNVAKAKEYLNKAGKAKGEAGWSEKAFTVIAQIDQEEQQAKAADAKKKAEAAAAAKAKAAPKPAPGGGAAPAAGGAPGGGAPPAQPASQPKPGP